MNNNNNPPCLPLLISIFDSEYYVPISSFFSTPFIIFALLFSLRPSRNSEPGSHSRLFSPTHYCSSCLAFFIARRLQLFLASSTPRRIVPTHARRSQQLILFIFRKKHVQNITTAGFELHMSRINTILVRSSIRGQPQDHRGDRLYNAPPQHE